MGQQCSQLVVRRQSKHRCSSAQGAAQDSSVLFDKYIPGRQLAPKCVEVTHRISRAVYVAYRLRKSSIPCKGLGAPRVAARLGRIQSLDHPNICQLVDVFEDQQYVHLVYSKVAGPPLLEAISKKAGHSEDAVAAIAYQLARALHVGVDTGIFHGALAPKNLFMNGDRVEITDFGLAGLMKPAALETGPCKSMFYMAPEMVKPFLGKCKDVKPDCRHSIKLESGLASKPSEAADIWSLGVIVFTLLSGRTPFLGNYKTGELAKNISSADLKFGHDMEGSVTKECLHFISRLLQKDPLRRPSAAEVLKHPWLHLQRGAAAPMDPSIVEHLGTIQAESHLKKAMMRMIASRVPPDKIKELEAAFDAMDMNRDGMVCLREFRLGLAKLGFSKDLNNAEIEAVFKELDHDGCGKIGFREFLAATIDSQRILVDEVLWDVFKFIDRDRNGTVSREELASAVRNTEGRLGQEYVDVIVDQLEWEIREDLTFEEFRALIMEEGGRQRLASSCLCSPCGSLQRVPGQTLRRGGC